MARISFPKRGMGEHVDWALLRPEMAVGMGALSKAVYENTKLALREREAARWTIALRDGGGHGGALEGRLREHQARSPGAGSGPVDDRSHQRLCRLPRHPGPAR